jgi:hypothetical protein
MRAIDDGIAESKLSGRTRALAAFIVASSVAGGAWLACDPTGNLGGTQGAPVYGPTGAIIQVTFSGAAAGATVAFSATPGSLSVSPASVTADPSGHATTYVTVPYSAAGAVIASAQFATASSVGVSCGPLVLCQPELDASVFGGGSQVYGVSALALLPTSPPSLCDGGAGDAAAPPGVPIAFALDVPATVAMTPAGASSSSDGGSGGAGGTGASSASTAVTNQSGVAATFLQIPWGPSVIVQASAGGATSTSLTQNVANPAAITCLNSVPQEGGVYQVSALVTNDGGAMPGVSVSFSVLPAGASVGTVTPPSSLTTGNGVAYTILTVNPDAGVPPVLEAIAGSSVYTAPLGAAGASCGQ